LIQQEQIIPKNAAITNCIKKGTVE